MREFAARAPAIRWRSRRTVPAARCVAASRAPRARVLCRERRRGRRASLGEPLTFPPARVRLMSFRSYRVGAFVGGRGVAHRLHVHDVKRRQQQRS